MTLAIKHPFVSPILDAGDPTLVGPSEWNDVHATTMANNKLLGRATAGTGAIEEITLGTGLSFTGTTLNGGLIVTTGVQGFYVDGALGTDVAGQGLSPGAGAYKTLQFAVNDICPRWFFLNDSFISLAHGTYNEQVFLPPVLGDSTLFISGDAAAPTAVSIVSPGPRPALWAFGPGGAWGVNNCLLSSPSQTNFEFGTVTSFGPGCRVEVSNCTFGNTGGASNVAASSGATLTATGNLTINGTGAWALAACRHPLSTVDFQHTAVTLSIDPAYTGATLFAERGAYINWETNSLSGTASNAKYSAGQSAYINVASDAAVPGVEIGTVTQTGMVGTGTNILHSAPFVGDTGGGGTVGFVPPPAIGDGAKFLRGDATWQSASASLAVGSSAITGGTSLRVLYDNAGVLGEYTNTQLTAIINNFSSTLSGTVAASGGGTSNFLRADGTWTAPSATLTIGTSAISGGTTKHVLYDLAGVLQEAANFTIESGNPNVVAGNAYMYNGVNVITAQTAQNNFYDGGAGNLTATGSGNLGTGFNCLPALTTGGNNLCIGVAAGFSITSGAINCFIGASAGQTVTTTSNNVAIGSDAMLAVAVPQNCIAIGGNAMQNGTGAINDCIGIGTSSLSNFAGGTAADCVAIGSTALAGVLTGTRNNAIGGFALNAVTSGGHKNGVGYQSGAHITTGGDNTCLGHRAGLGIVAENFNVSIGSQAMLQSSGANNCISIGANSLFFVAADNNIAIGYQSGFNITSGADNILIGVNSGGASDVTTGANNIQIGSDVRVPSATASNQLCIGNYIYGTGLSGTGTTVSTALIGLGIKAPTAVLHLANSSTAAANLRFDPTGAAGPTTPNDGDMWYDGTNLKFRHGGVTTTIV